jgi:hypothetical protein
MRYARNKLVSRREAGYYHCISRCVRRAFLCGRDKLTGRSFEHRREWIENRLLFLAETFAMGICAYAVMSNHVHVVVHVDPEVASRWTAEEVANRWVKLFPARVFRRVDDMACQVKAASIASNPERVAVCREQLSSLSWFMRCLNEPIARMANREDACTGRFWEGRYKCQALLDEAALLACMTYVDLNPVRAGAATDLESSLHTSIRRRLQNAHRDDEALAPVCGTVRCNFPLTIRDYVSLVEWTGRRLHPRKFSSAASDPPVCLRKLGIRQESWIVQSSSIETRYWRAVGSAESLLRKALELGQCWLKGCRSVLALSPQDGVGALRP